MYAEQAKQNAAQAYEAYSYSAQAQTNSLRPNTPPAPLTLASALSRSDALNERIAQSRSRLEEIAGKLGALHPAEPNVKCNPVSPGVVDRLNGAADLGHERMCEIESLLGCIERALG